MRHGTSRGGVGVRGRCLLVAVLVLVDAGVTAAACAANSAEIAAAAGEGAPQPTARAENADRGFSPPDGDAEATPDGDAEATPDGAADPEQRRQYAGPEEDQVFFEAYWNQGIKYRLLGRVRLEQEGWYVGPKLTREPLLIGEIGVKLHVDAAAYVEADGLEDIDDRIDLRRSFLIARGTFFSLVYPIDFSIEMGAITDSFFINQGYLRLNDLPYLGSFKIGQYTAPLSFESTMNSRDLGLMEAASPVQAFSPGILAGMQLADQYREPRMSWALGFFGDGQDGEVGDASEDFASVVGRLTWVPLQSAPGEEPSLLHVGLGASYLFSASDTIRYQSRPESFLAPFAIDTGVIDASHGLVINAEAAFVKGPFSGQFEYFQANAGGGNTNNTVYFPGIYLQLNGFLTGEHRPYDDSNAVFGQVLPLRPLSIQNRTWGAWEWGGRYSYSDLDDGDVQGGRMHTLTAGLNWYWNRYLRMQFNYGWSLIDDGVLDGRLNTFQMRFQLVL